MHTPINGKLVIHRDLKSDNILVKTDQHNRPGKFELKISDFGYSKIIEVGEFVRGDASTRSKHLAFLNKYKNINELNFPYFSYNGSRDVWLQRQ